LIEQAQHALDVNESGVQTQKFMDNIKKLQDEESFWRREASRRLEEVTDTETTLRKLLRDLQRERYLVRTKEEREAELIGEIHKLQNKIEIISKGFKLNDSPSSPSEHLTSQSRDIDLNSPFSNIVKLQAELLRKGRYEDAERLALSFNTIRLQKFKTSELRDTALGCVPQEASIPRLVSDRAEERTSDPREQPSNLLSYEEIENQGSKHLKSIAPPFHEKLSIENRLARVSDSCLLHPHQPWKLQVQLNEASGIRWKDGVQQALCCFSSIEASAKLSSQSFQSIYHVGDQGTSLIDNSLCIQAACSSAHVQVGRDVTKWNETVELDDLQVFQNSDQEQELEVSRKAMQGQCLLLLITVHSFSEEQVEQVGRTALVIREQSDRHHILCLLDPHGAPLLNSAGDGPATISIQCKYFPSDDNMPGSV